MKFRIAILCLLMVCVLYGCGQRSPNVTMPTGTGGDYEESSPVIMHESQYYTFAGYDSLVKKLPEGFHSAGKVVSVESDTPEENYEGAWVESGTRIYADETNSDCIFVKDLKGYYEFVLSER